jgi:hypothetical protein
VRGAPAERPTRALPNTAPAGGQALSTVTPTPAQSGVPLLPALQACGRRCNKSSPHARGTKDDRARAGGGAGASQAVHMMQQQRGERRLVRYRISRITDFLEVMGQYHGFCTQHRYSCRPAHFTDIT